MTHIEQCAMHTLVVSVLEKWRQNPHLSLRLKDSFEYHSDSPSQKKMKERKEEKNGGRIEGWKERGRGKEGKKER